MMKTRWSTHHVMACAALAAAFVGCRPVANQSVGSELDLPPPEPVRVIATTPLVAELVRRVGGDGVEVTVLLPVDQPPTALQRTGPIESLLVAAELVVVLGLGQEAVLAPSLARAVEEGTLVCELAAAVPAERLIARVDDPAQSDPHIWLDPETWMDATRPIEDALIRLRPLRTDDWRNRAHAARFELEETARLIRRLTETGLPVDPDPIRTVQPGLRYLARAANLPLEVVVDPAQAPRADELETLPLNLLRAPGVSAVATIHEHDLGTVDGLRAYALDLMIKRRQ